MLGVGFRELLKAVADSARLLGFCVLVPLAQVVLMRYLFFKNR